MKNYIALIGPDGEIWPCKYEQEQHNDVAIRIFNKKEAIKKIKSKNIESINFVKIYWNQIIKT